MYYFALGKKIYQLTSRIPSCKVIQNAPREKHHPMFVCSFFFALGLNFLNFSLIYRLTDSFSFSTGQIGRYIALGQLFYFLGCSLYHRFGSAVHPSKILPVSVVTVFLASIPLGYFKILGPVYASYCLLQLAASLFWPPTMAWLTEGLSGNELSQQISYFNRSWMAALIIAPPIAGFLYRWNSEINFLVITLCFFVNILVLFFIMRRHKTSGLKKENLDQPAAASDAETHSSSPFHQSKKFALYRYMAWAGIFCSIIFVGVFSNIVPLHIRDSMAYTESTAGIVLFFRCTAGFAGFVLMAKFTVWHFNFRWFIILQAGLVFCALLFLFGGNQLSFYFGIAIIFGLIHAACTTNSIFYSRATGKNPKKNLALHEMFLCGGNAAGTAGGGLIYQHFGFTGTAFALVLILCIGFGGFVFLNKKSSRY